MSKNLITPAGVVIKNGLPTSKGIIVVHWFYPVELLPQAFEVAKVFFGRRECEAFWPNMKGFMPTRLGDPDTGKETHVFCAFTWTEQEYKRFLKHPAVLAVPEFKPFLFNGTPEEYIATTGLLLMGEGKKSWREPHWVMKRLEKEWMDLKARRMKGEKLNGKAGIGPLQSHSIRYDVGPLPTSVQEKEDQ